MQSRRFRPDDAEFCFRVRSSAYIVEFYDELGPEVVAACVNAYLPADYLRLSQEMEVFVVEDGGVPVGFYTIRRAGPTRAEIPLIYVDLEHLGRGIGWWCMSAIENWIREHWSEVTTLFVDTIIPKYNGGFYQKAGFQQVAETVCTFRALNVPAIRFEKALGA